MRFRSAARRALAAAALITVASISLAPRSFAACPQPAFKTPITLSGIGFNPGTHTIQSADLNQDGLDDLLVADSTGTSVLLANGTGRFLAGFSSGTGIGPRAVAVLDADGDGYQDFLMAFSIENNDHDGTTLLPCLSRLGGQFESPIDVSYQDVGRLEEPRAMVAADFTGDGKTDIVIAGKGGPALTWGINQGGAHFAMTTGGLQWAPDLGLPVALAAGDIDGDKFSDLVIHTVRDVAGSTLQEVVVFFGGGSGYSGIVKTFTVGNGAFEFTQSNTLVVTDLNGDGKLDIAVQDPANGSVAVSLCDGTRNLGSVTHFPAAGVALASGDLNSDGFVDLATCDPVGQQVCVLLGNGSGSFAAATCVPTGGAASAIAINRFNNTDGSMDIAVANNAQRSATVLLNACAGADIDVRVTGIEVTQIVQDLANTVLLVAGKRTFVRVHAAANYDKTAVTATLQPLDSHGAPLGPELLPSNEGGLVAVRETPDRANRDEAFYFELPAALTKAGTIAVRATINPGHAMAEANYANNTMTSPNVTFQTAKVMKLRVVDYSFRRHDGVITENTPADFAYLKTAIRSELPIDSLEYSQVSVFDSNPPAVLTDGLDDAKADADALIAWLKNYRATKEPQNAGVIYYVLNREIHGMAEDIPSLNAVGTNSAATHEIGHMMGRYHTNCSGGEDGPDQSYPFAGGKIGGPVGDTNHYYGLSTGTDRPNVIPSTTGDIMGYCSPHWTSSHNLNAIWTYRNAHPQMIARLGNGLSAASLAAVGAATARAQATGDFLAVYGSLDPATESLTLANIGRLAAVDEIPADETGPYHLRLLDENETTLADHPFQVHATTEGGPGGVFGRVVDFEPGTRKVQIVSDNSSNVLADIPVSANAPTVSITTVVAGVDLSVADDLTLEWIGDDLDGDALHYDIEYSADGGSTWEPVVTGLTDSHASLPSSLLRGTGGAATGFLRVVASDGVLTGSDQGGPMTVADKAPTVLILHPFTATTFTYGQTVTLEGSAHDLEDGDLDDAQYTWSSNLSGLLGTGRVLHVLDLPPGKHTVHCTVTDQAGNQSDVAVAVLMGPKVTRNSSPVMVSASPDLTVKEGAAVALSASAMDPDADQTIAVTAAGYPADLTYTAGSGIAPGTVQATVAGTVGYSDGDQNPTKYTIEWTASDGALAVSATTTLSVLDVVPIRFTMTPGTLNLKSMGRWVTGYLQPPAPYTAADIDTPTVSIAGGVGVDPEGPAEIGDFDGDGIPDLAVKFDRAAVELQLQPGDDVEVVVTGEMAGRYLIGTDHIRVLRAKVTAPRAGENLMPGTKSTVTWTTPTGVKVQSVALLSCFDGGITWNLEASGLPNVGHYDWNVPNVNTSRARVAVVLVESADATGFLVDGVLGTSGDFTVGNITGVEASEAPRFALRAARPNPTVEGLRVNFGLADARPAKVEVFDVSGRRVAAREVGGLGAGFHTILLDERRALPSGVYLIRLSQAGKKLVTRAVLVR